jgi:hypothetical protein
MKVFQVRQDEGVFTKENLRVGANLFITLIGVLMVLIGLYFSVKLFFRIFDALLYPEHIRELLMAWSQTMEWHVLEVDFQGKTLSFGRSFALVVIGVGGFLLVSIALAMVRTGARIIAFATEEREAIKDILQYSLGELWESVHKKGSDTETDRKR